MKITLLTLFIGCYSLLSFGQVKEIYLYDDLSPLTKKEFNQMDNSFKYFEMIFNLDTLIVNLKVTRVDTGKIAKATLDSIKSEITTLSSQPIPSDHLIIINYYHGIDGCNASAQKQHLRIRYKKYLKELTKLEKVNQYFMYKSAEGTKEYGKKLKWIKDESGIIERTFFPIAYPCGSFVTLDAAGNFYKRKGEYDILKIIDLVKNK